MLKANCSLRNSNIHTPQVSIKVLSWEPSLALLIVTPAVYPRLVENNDLNNFSLYKLTHSIQFIKTKLRTFPWFPGVSQLKFEENRSKGPWVMIWHTIKQTDKQKLQLYIYITSKPPGHKTVDWKLEVWRSFSWNLNKK